MIGELLAIVVVLITYFFYKKTSSVARYFKERNLKYRGALDTFRVTLSVLFGKMDVYKMSHTLYNYYPDEPLFGSFDLVVRQYFIRDPKIFKRIAIKDFDNFENHRDFVDTKMDELFGNTLFLLQGEKWRQMRATLSPAFTGTKIRQMFDFVTECCDGIVKHFVKKIEKGEQINIEMKEFFSRYTNDVIASCAFGLKVNSFDDPNNEFFMNGRKMLDFSGIKRTLRVFFTFVVPKISRLFNMRIFDESVTSIFKNIILDTMAQRQKNNIHRPDMVNLLLQVREGNSLESTEDNVKGISDEFTTVGESDVGNPNVTRKWEDNELIAQCLSFFMSGFDTTSFALTFAAYELVVNQNVQQKLYEEIVEVNEQLQGERLSFAVLQNMKYMDQVISETLRKWSIGIQTDRTCSKDYVYDDGKRKFTIEKGSNILVSIYGIHHNPKFFPNPEKFDPARFSDENKHKILPDTYIPFGIGPRKCIGSRFALMELKAILYYLLLSFSFEPNKNTQIPLKMDNVPVIKTEKGVHLQLKPRTYVSYI